MILLSGSTGEEVFFFRPFCGGDSCFFIWKDGGVNSAPFFMIFPFNSRMGLHVEKGELRGEGMAVAGEKAGMAADAGKMEFRLD